jgi:predicted metal-dependent HD superfamily phosphohydrolase
VANQSAAVLESVGWVISSYAIDDITLRYGKHGKNPKAHNNEAHTEQVLDSAARLAELAIANGNLDERDKALIIIAAAYHAYEQELGKGFNESASAKAAQASMRETGIFSPPEIISVGGMIMATQLRVDDGKLHQAVPPNHYGAKIVADADLSSVGMRRDIFWDNSVAVFNEFRPQGVEQCIGQLSFMDSHVCMLRSHTFHTVEAQSIFTGKDANLEFSEAVLASLLFEAESLE